MVFLQAFPILDSVDALKLGSKCGSTCIDTAFMSWLREKLGDDLFSKLKDPRKRIDPGAQAPLSPELQDLVNQFIKCKHIWDGENGPFKLELSGDLYGHNDPGRDIIEGDIKISKCGFLSS